MHSNGSSLLNQVFTFCTEHRLPLTLLDILLAILQKIRPVDATFVVADFQILSEADCKTIKESIKPMEYNRFMRGIGKDPTTNRSSATEIRKVEGVESVFRSPPRSATKPGNRPNISAAQ